MRKRKLNQTEKLARYKSQINRALRDMAPEYTKWRTYIEFYRGEQWDPKLTLARPDNAVVVNQIGPVINTILPSIYTQPPRARVKALRPQNEHDAPLAEAVINYDWRRIDVDAELRLAALDMLSLGIGWVNVGYEFEEATTPRDPDEVEADVQEMIATVQELVAGVQPAMRAEFAPRDEALPSLGAEGATEPGMDEAVADAELGQAPEFAADELPSTDGAPPMLAALMREETEGLPAEDTIDAELVDMNEGMPQQGMMHAPIDPSLLPDEATIRTIVPTEETITLADDIFVERVSPFDVLVDTNARSMNEARWVARRRLVALDEVQANPNYRNTRDLKGSPNPNLNEREAKPSNIPSLGPNQSDPYADEFVVLWEYYNLREDTFCVFTLDSDKFLFEGPWEMPFKGGPFVRIPDYEVPDSLWSFGEIQLILDLQIELNRTRTQIINHNRRFNRKFLANAAAIGNDGRAALESPIDGEVIMVTNNQDLKNVVLPVPDGPLPADRYQLSQMIETDIQAVTGVTDYERGAFGSVRRTATEASIIQEASSLRQQDKLRRVEDAATEIARRMLRLAQSFYDRERWILITGNGWQIPVRFDLRDIEGEYDLSVEAGSTLPLNQEVRKQQAEQLFMLLGQDPMVNHLELLKYLLKEHGLQNPDRFLDPMGQMGLGAMGMGGPMGANPMGFGGDGSPLSMGGPGVTGMQPGQLGMGTPQEIGGGAQGGQQAAGVR